MHNQEYSTSQTISKYYVCDIKLYIVSFKSQLSIDALHIPAKNNTHIIYSSISTLNLETFCSPYHAITFRSIYSSILCPNYNGYSTPRIDSEDARGERGLNTRPSDLQSDALPTELSPQNRCTNRNRTWIFSIANF